MRKPAWVLLYYAYNSQVWRNTDASLLEVDELTHPLNRCVDTRYSSVIRGDYRLSKDTDLSGELGISIWIDIDL